MNPQVALTKKSIAWVVVLTAVGSFMAALDALVASTALPTIRRDLVAVAAGLALLGAVAGSLLPGHRHRTEPVAAPVPRPALEAQG